jgi:hypothetical protein
MTRPLNITKGGKVAKTQNMLKGPTLDGVKMGSEGKEEGD